MLVSMSEGELGGASRQQVVGAASRRDTRQRLLDSAAEEFEANGYTAATVSRIASRAGVTVQTLYLAWGSKRALLRAYLESTLADGSHAPGDVSSRFTDQGPAGLITQLANVFVETANRSAVGWRLYREAAATDGEIAADWAELQSLRRATYRGILGLIPEVALQPGLTTESATDTAWVIASPDTFDLLVRHNHYSPKRYLEWLSATLRSALVDSTGAGTVRFSSD